ncbi:MAG: copper resistance protein CopC, partial [Herbiconiux sp.]|nr:copper resistance protein CopC [Herbiconiux sp.]
MRKTRPRTASLLAVGALALAASLFPAASASAHDGLASSTPADGDTLTADPGSVALTFTDELLTVGGTTDGFAIQVTDPEGLHYESGCVTISGSDASTPIALGDAGGYVVQWQVVSSDGHPTSGQYEFDYEPASPDGREGLTQAPVCGDAWAGLPDGTPTAAPTATPDPAASTPATAPAP